MAHVFAASLGASACEYPIPVGSLSLSSQLFRSTLSLTIERDVVARSEIAVWTGEHFVDWLPTWQKRLQC